MQIIEDYKNWLGFEKKRSQNTSVSYINDLLKFIDFLKEAYPEHSILEVDEAMIKSWFIYLIKNGISSSTIHRKRSSLNSFFNFLMENGYTENNPVLLTEAPKKKKRLAKFIPENEITQLLKELEPEADKEEILILEVFYFTGMRLSELINLKVKNFNNNSLKILGKGSKERMIPLNKEISEKIAVHIQKKPIVSEYIFNTKNGGKLYPMYVYRLVTKYLAIIKNISKRSPHILRHTFATHLMNNGAELLSIKKLLGHENLMATQIYTHNSLDRLKNIYKIAHPKA